MRSPNVISYRGRVTRSSRERQNNHQAKAFWFTGLSGSGKSTLAHLVEKKLHDLGMRTYTFDGDNVRQGLCADLSFSPEGRAENLRRIGEMVRLFLDAGTICLTAFISPSAKDRQKVKNIIGSDDFFEIFINCPLEICEQRDVKGLYALARAGKIENYTGISAPYEDPIAPDLVVLTHILSIAECVQAVTDFILCSLNTNNHQLNSIA